MELAHHLQATDDPAAALRKLQLVYLDEWRRASTDLSGWRRNGLPEKEANTPFPMIWAAYCCIGAANHMGWGTR